MKRKIKLEIARYFISLITATSFFPSSVIAQSGLDRLDSELVAKTRNGTAEDIMWCEQGLAHSCNAAASTLVLQAQYDVFQAIRSVNGVYSNIVRHLSSASQPRDDVEAAAALYERSCSLVGSYGWEIGCEQLGWYYFSHQFLPVESAQSLNLAPPDYPRALELFELACTVNHAYACEVAGGLHLSEVYPGIEYNLDLGLEFFDRGCRFDNGYACELLADGYLYGNYGQQDISLARYYYMRACQLGNDLACDNARDLD